MRDSVPVSYTRRCCHATSVILALAPLSIGQLLFFFFNDTATTEIYTLSLHHALPIYCGSHLAVASSISPVMVTICSYGSRSEEHTSELQSLRHLVCRLLLEKKKKKTNNSTDSNYAPERTEDDAEALRRGPTAGNACKC